MLLAWSGHLCPHCLFLKAFFHGQNRKSLLSINRMCFLLKKKQKSAAKNYKLCPFFVQSHFDVYSAEMPMKCDIYWCNHGPGTAIFSLQISFSCFATLLTNSLKGVADIFGAYAVARVSCVRRDVAFSPDHHRFSCVSFAVSLFLSHHLHVWVFVFISLNQAYTVELRNFALWRVTMHVCPKRSS